MRVFIGCEEIASVIGGLSTGFRELGHEVTAMVTQPPRFDLGAQFDVVRGKVLGRFARAHTNASILSRFGDRADDFLSPVWNGIATPQYLAHDLFVFVWRPWVPSAALFPLLKRLGRKIVVYYLGSEVRFPAAFSQEFGVDVANWGESVLRESLAPKLRKVRVAERYADAIFSVPDQAGLQLRPYFHTWLPVVVPLERAPRPQNSRPLVLHAPSTRDLKGTSHVVAAVEALKAAGHQFDFELISGRPRAEVLAALARADILVDELLLHGPGVLSAEAMLLGCAVATRTLAPHGDWNPPVLDVRPATVQAGIERLLTDVPFREALRDAGWAWARKHVNPAAVAKRVLDAVEGGRPEYEPRFFVDRFTPPSGLRIDLATRALTETVVNRWCRSPADDLRSLKVRGLA